MRRLLAVTLTLTLAGCRAAVDPSPVAPAGPVRVQVLGINDFHGHLLPPMDPVRSPRGEVIAGGAAYLATHLARLRADNPRTVVVSAGDLVGASPLISGLFHDEPTVEVMNALGLDYDGIGNHEFDEGAGELLRLARGGCHPGDGCVPGARFEGARFGILAANVLGPDGRTLFPPYAIRELDGVRVAFVGVTTRETPAYTPPVIPELRFLDEADAVNALVPELVGQGARAIVVLLHEGGFAGDDPEGCDDLRGPVASIVPRLHPEVDVVLSGHTHQAYRCRVGRVLVTSAGSFGRLVTDIDLAIDPATGQVLEAEATNRVVTRDVEPDPVVLAVVERWRDRSAGLAARVVGEAAAPLSRRPGPSGESGLGSIIADAQLEATAGPERGGADLALMNSGGIRTDVAAGEVTYGDLFDAQPFGNTLVTVTLTGRQLVELLEGQWREEGSRLLQVSDTLRYGYRAGAPPGQRIDLASATVRGAPLALDGRYRVTVNSYLAARGVLARGTERTQGMVDLDALERYLAARRPISPPPPGRIRKLD